MRNKKDRFYFQKPYEPSLEEIRRACEEIQKGWSSRDKKARIVSDPYNSENIIPTIHVIDDNFVKDSFYGYL